MLWNALDRLGSNKTISLPNYQAPGAFRLVGLLIIFKYYPIVLSIIYQSSVAWTGKENSGILHKIVNISVCHVFIHFLLWIIAQSPTDHTTRGRRAFPYFICALQKKMRFGSNRSITWWNAEVGVLFLFCCVFVLFSDCVSTLKAIKNIYFKVLGLTNLLYKGQMEDFLSPFIAFAFAIEFRIISYSHSLLISLTHLNLIVVIQRKTSCDVICKRTTTTQVHNFPTSSFQTPHFHSTSLPLGGWATRSF